MRCAQLDVSWVKWIVYIAVALVIIFIITQGASIDWTERLSLGM